MEPAENMESFHKMLFISCMIWYDEENLHCVELFNVVVWERRVNEQTK